MASTSKAPLRLAGAVLNSGNVGTGEQNLTLGGQMAVTFYSGMLDYNLSGGKQAAFTALGAATGSGNCMILASGAGRLKDVFTHSTGWTASGVQQPLILFDASLVTSGAPFPASGHKTLIAIGGSILSGLTLPVNQYYAFDLPYQSGLCISVLSGFPGFTVTFTAEPQPALANPG